MKEKHIYRKDVKQSFTSYYIALKKNRYIKNKARQNNRALQNNIVLFFYFLLSRLGNHPFSTLFFCSKSSPILQKEEAPHTANSVE